jgi:hypothetical protein
MYSKSAGHPSDRSIEKPCPCHSGAQARLLVPFIEAHRIHLSAQLPDRQGVIMPYGDDPESVISEFTPHRLVANCGAGIVVMRPIDENANTGHSFALVEEVRLRVDFGRWPDLRVGREMAALLWFDTDALQSQGHGPRYGFLNRPGGGF